MAAMLAEPLRAPARPLVLARPVGARSLLVIIFPKWQRGRFNAAFQAGRRKGSRLAIWQFFMREETMSDLIFIAFDSEQRAEEVREKILEMQKEYLIELGDAVVAVKDANGRIKLNQLINPVSAGAWTGALWGGLIGLIFLNPLIGMGIGAASGALWRETVRHRHQRRFHERVGQRAEARDRRSLPAGPENDDGQGPEGPEGRRRDGRQHILRRDKGSGHSRGAGGERRNRVGAGAFILSRRGFFAGGRAHETTPRKARRDLRWSVLPLCDGRGEQISDEAARLKRLVGTGAVWRLPVRAIEEENLDTPRAKDAEHPSTIAGLVALCRIPAVDAARAESDSQLAQELTSGVSQLLRVGRQIVQLGVSGRYFVEKPAGGPTWGLRLSAAWVLPTGRWW
jgi:Protein of unknown function (DUF1269)